MIHDAVNYVDDARNIVGAENLADIQEYLIKFNLLLLHYYGSNKLKLNDQKLQIMVLKGRFQRMISIKAEDGTIVWNVAQIKILDIHVNPQNDMMTNITRARATAMHRMSQLMPIVKQMKTIEQRCQCITACVLSILRYCAPLYVGQKEEIHSKYHTAMMKAYRCILNENTYLMRNKTICEKISLPMPREQLAKYAVIFLHKLIMNRKPVQVYQRL